MENRIQGIIKKYKTGKLDDDLDESGADGFWDLAGDIIRSHNDYDKISITDGLQSEIYSALKTMLNEIK